MSAAHKVFDPLGITCPVTLTPKLLLKQLWAHKIDWDTPLDEKIQIEFLRWNDVLNLLKIIEIPRELGTMNLSLHTFCDASKLACGIVIDLRSGNENEVNVCFVAAKSELAPENSTIPRLELFAASTRSRLAHELNKVLSNKIPNYF